MLDDLFDLPELSELPAFDFPDLSDPAIAAGGGFPDFWNNIDDIIAGAGDLLAKIGALFTDLGHLVWDKVGGTVRWATQTLSNNLLVFWATADAGLGYAYRGIVGVGRWVADTTAGNLLTFWAYADAGLGYAYRGIVGGFRWVEGSARSALEAALDWVDMGFGYAYRGIIGGFRWATETLSNNLLVFWATADAGLGYAYRGIVGVGRWVADTTAGNLLTFWDTVDAGFGAAYRGIVGGFRYVYDKVSDVGDYLYNAMLEGPGSVVGVVGSALGDLGSGIVAGIGSLLGPLISGIADLPGKLGGAIGDATAAVWGAIFEPFVELFDRKLAIPGKMLAGQYPTFQSFLTDLMDPPSAAMRGLTAVPLFFLMIIVSIIAQVSPVLAPYNMYWQQDAHVGARDALLPPSMVGDAHNRFLTVSHGYAEHLARQGYRNEDIAVILELRRRLLNPQDVQEAYLRRIPLSEDWPLALLKMGYTDVDTQALLELAHRLPGPSDLVRMGVREVFTPEIAEAFGQFKEMPAGFERLMQLEGYSPAGSTVADGSLPDPSHTWAQAFWAAHWDLPSISQAFEFLHRGVKMADGHLFDTDDLNFLLRALDVMPNWRDPLRQISYNPLTRVDIRRVFKAGVVQEDKVLQVYKALGYSPEDAAILTAWVVKEYAPGGTKDTELRAATLATVRAAYARRLLDRDGAMDRLREDLDYETDDAELILAIWDFDFFLDPSERSALKPQELSRSIIEQAYERGLVDGNRASAELEELGYTPEDAALVIQLVDYKTAQELADLEADVHIAEYRGGFITEADLAARLSDLDIPQKRIDLLVQRELLRRATKTAELTRADLLSAARRGLIDEGEWRVRLQAKGYADVDVDIIVALGAPA